MKVGRPNVITENALRKLEEAFSVGATDLEACFLVNISKTSLYEYQKKNLEFMERKEALKSMLKYRAKVNISKEIEKGNLETSKWYLERKAKEEFSSRQDLNHGITEEVKTLFTEEQIRAIAERIITRNTGNI